MKQVIWSDFQASITDFLKQVKLTGEPLEIFKDGEPLAVIFPPIHADRKKNALNDNAQRKKSSFGILKKSVIGEVGDLIEHNLPAHFYP
jgi:hypothetical protein